MLEMYNMLFKVINVVSCLRIKSSHVIQNAIDSPDAEYCTWTTQVC